MASTGQSFYQHRAPEPVPPGVRIETLPDDDVPARLIGGSLKTLLYMAQLASISMDPWFSTMDDLDSADQVAIDLDPQPGATFDRRFSMCARWVARGCSSASRCSGFPKTSGSEGLHVFIPLPPGTPYEAGMLFCQIVATMVASEAPEGGHGRAHGRQAQGRHGLCRLPAEHPGQDARVRLQRPRQRVCRRVDAADLERSARPPDAAGLHPRHDDGPRRGRRGPLGRTCGSTRARTCWRRSRSCGNREPASTADGNRQSATGKR